MHSGWWLGETPWALALPSLQTAPTPPTHKITTSPTTPQGERIKRVYEETGVTKIDVTDQGVVRIAGPTNGAVLRAREMLELLQVRVGGWVGV